MERHDIRMFTSAWKRYYQDSIRGCYMPQLGEWSVANGWVPGSQQLHVEENFINPAPLVLIVTGRIRDRDLSVTINYTTAVLSSWETQYYNGKSYQYPVYVTGTTKNKTFTIPKFTDAETIMRICQEDNLIYKINSVTVSNYRNDERFFIYALASPSAKLVYAQDWHVLYETMVAEKRGLFAAHTACPTCQGTKFAGGSMTCPECDGWGFSGTNAVGVQLDRLGMDVGLTRESTNEPDEKFAKKVWARRWWLVPEKSELKRYFEHFCHVGDDGIDIVEIFDEQEPTFFVAVDPSQMGSKAIWQPGEQFEDYDGMVERACPAGVNGFFGWLGVAQEDVNPIHDSVTMQPWAYGRDGYGSQWEVSMFMEAGFGELEDFAMPNFLDDFDSYTEGADIETEAAAYQRYTDDMEAYPLGEFTSGSGDVGDWAIEGCSGLQRFDIVNQGGSKRLQGVVTGSAQIWAYVIALGHPRKLGATININHVTTGAFAVDIDIPASPRTGVCRVEFRSDHSTWCTDGSGTTNLNYTWTNNTDFKMSFWIVTDHTFRVFIGGMQRGGTFTFTEEEGVVGDAWFYFGSPNANDVYKACVDDVWSYNTGTGPGKWELVGGEFTGNDGKGKIKATASTGLEKFDTYGEAGTSLDGKSGPIGDWLLNQLGGSGDTLTVEADGDGFCAKYYDSSPEGYSQPYVLLDTPIEVGDVFCLDYKTSTITGSYGAASVFRTSDMVQWIQLSLGDGSGNLMYNNGSGWGDTFNDMVANTWYTIWYKVISNTTFKVYAGARGCAEPNWNTVTLCTTSRSLEGTTLGFIGTIGRGDSSFYQYFANIKLAGYTAGEDGEAIGTYPVVSGTAYRNYRAKMDVLFTESAKTYQLEAGITENAKTADADLRIHLAFKNSDRLVYYHDGSSFKSTGIYWNEPHDGERVEKFDGSGNLDDDAQWAPFTGDDSDNVTCGAEYLEGEGHFYVTVDDALAVVKLYTFPVASGGTGIVNVYADINVNKLGDNKTFWFVVGGTDAGGTPAVYLQAYNHAGVMEYSCFTGSMFKAITGIEECVWKKQFKFELDMDNQHFKIYQKVLGAWKLLTIADDYEDFWGSVAVINVIFVQLSGGISHVYIDNIANDWDTETESCDATFEVSVVASNKFRIRKNEEEWSPELTCKNAFTAGMKHLKLKTTDTGGVEVDNLEYAW